MAENDIQWTKPQQKIKLKKSANRTLDTSQVSCYIVKRVALQEPTLVGRLNFEGARLKSFAL